jgi:DNA polymerase III subunit delta'
MEQFLARVFHAGLIIGPAGSGKATLARHIASQLVGLDIRTFENYPYIQTIAPIDNKAIPIESIRELQHFMALKIPGSDGSKTSRIAIIEDAHLMSIEAQNALLKTLEEPPEGTVLLLTAATTESMLPTIQSRVQAIHIVPPAIADVKQYFSGQFDDGAIERAILVSGGLPGLTHALLTANDDHPLVQATAQARQLLQAKAYERLTLVDILSKQKQQTQDVLFILGQMSRMALMRMPAGNPAVKRWQSILRASHEASGQLRHNTQAKLVLTRLMLEL